MFLYLYLLLLPIADSFSVSEYKDIIPQTSSEFAYEVKLSGEEMKDVSFEFLSCVLEEEVTKADGTDLLVDSKPSTYGNGEVESPFGCRVSVVDFPDNNTERVFCLTFNGDLPELFEVIVLRNGLDAAGNPKDKGSKTTWTFSKTKV
jgi:hypothetical protein